MRIQCSLLIYVTFEKQSECFSINQFPTPYQQRFQKQHKCTLGATEQSLRLSYVWSPSFVLWRSLKCFALVDVLGALCIGHTGAGRATAEGCSPHAYGFFFARLREGLCFYVYVSYVTAWSLNDLTDYGLCGFISLIFF